VNRVKVVLAPIIFAAVLCPSAIQAASVRHGVAHRPANIGTIKKDGTCADTGGIRLYSKSGQSGLCVRYTGTGVAELCNDFYPGTTVLVCQNIASWRTLGSSGEGSFYSFGSEKIPYFPNSQGDLPGGFVNQTSRMSNGVTTG
jgi:hypothetical protein